MPECPNCKSKYEVGARFCPKCGKPIIKTKTVKFIASIITIFIVIFIIEVSYNMFYFGINTQDKKHEITFNNTTLNCRTSYHLNDSHVDIDCISKGKTTYSHVKTFQRRYRYGYSNNERATLILMDGTEYESDPTTITVGERLVLHFRVPDQTIKDYVFINKALEKELNIAINLSL